jgi:hypothetical protein
MERLEQRERHLHGGCARFLELRPQAFLIGLDGGLRLREGELRTQVELGIDYGQGFQLGRPEETFGRPISGIAPCLGVGSSA